MSSRPTSGRRSDSLFDNRYRVEQNYPRGRSGEVLYALDTQNGDQAVIIKRPALQDAPPMRAGQEQYILNEKRVLERLADHPAIPRVVNNGTFRVGGQAYQYIALELPTGLTVEGIIIGLASSGQAMPDLEMYMLFDTLLEAIHYLHDRKVAHNNLEPQQVFWDRQQYRIGLSGWDNAVMLDSDGVNPSASRTTDLMQVGQLLYYVVSGGQSLAAGQNVELGTSLSPRLKSILTRATAVESSQRYPTAAAFRQDLAELRRPLEKERDSLLHQARADLPGAQDNERLESLQSIVHRALTYDPAYPAAHELLAEIDLRLAQRAVEDNLHAIYVYMTSGNMVRAMAVLQELKARMGKAEQPVLDYLIDAATIMQANPIMPLSAGVSSALEVLLQGDAQTAGHILVTTHEPREHARRQQSLLAERLMLHIPDVVLLRPHLERLHEVLAVSPQTTQSRNVAEALLTKLDQPPTTGIAPIVTLYHEITQSLTNMGREVQSLGASSEPLSVLERAYNVSEQLQSQLNTALSNVITDPDCAADAINRAEAIDPSNVAFDKLRHSLASFHAELKDLQHTAVPGEGPEILHFLHEAKSQLEPYSSDITDPLFQAMVHGIDEAIASWSRVEESIALGGRRPAVTACQQAADAVRSFNPAIAAWFDVYAKQIGEINYVEHLSANSTFGGALEQGWTLWDKGQATDAKTAGERALGFAANEGEQHAAERLIALSDALAIWLANDGPLSAKRTEQTAAAVNSMFLPEEDNIRRTFSKQMPDAQIYLKAMVRGIVEPMRESSTAAVRTIFFDYCLRGLSALFQDKAEEANFWREAALKTLATARSHPAYNALDAGITRRQLILDAIKALNNVKHVSDLAAARTAVVAPLAASQLEATSQAIRAVDDALEHWAEGDFRLARASLENAIERITFAEATMGKELRGFKDWLQNLNDSAQVLQQARHTIEQIALVPADEPNPVIIEAHQKIIEVTRRDLGESYTVRLRQWRDTYNGIRDLYQDGTLTKVEKLRLLEDYPDDLTVEQFPALPIVRHWLGLIRRLPDQKTGYIPPSPAVGALYAAGVDPLGNAASYTPHESEVVEIHEPPLSSKTASMAASSATPLSPALNRGRGGSPATLVIGLLVLAIILLALGFLLFQTSPQNPDIPLTALSLNTTQTAQSLLIAENLTPSATVETATPASTDIPTLGPTSTPPTLPPTITKVVPTPTKPGAIPTNTPNTPVANPTLPAGIGPNGTLPTSAAGVLPTFVPTASSGDYDMLKMLETLPSSQISWNKDWFGPAGDGWQLGTDVFKVNGAPLIVRLGTEIMTALYGTDAANKLTRVEATLELVSYEKSLLPTGNVFFGFGLESLRGPRAAAQTTLVQEKVVDLGINQNGTFRRKTQLPITTAKMAVKIERNDDGTISLFVDGQLLGTSASNYAPGSPLNIYLYTSSPGVVVKVTAIKVHLEEPHP